jgi:hypothetical protein
MDESAQTRRRVIHIDRKVSKGQRKSLGQMNQLEALQLYLTMRQPDQAAKLEALGFDQVTMADLEAWLKPETKALGAWMSTYLMQDQDAVDAIHRAEKGVGLGLVANYFPVRNDVSRADNGGLSLDGQAPMQAGRSVGFIKERVTNYANPAVVNAVAVFLAHRSQVNFWKSHVAPLREWGGVIRDEAFATAVKTRMGETYYKTLTDLLQRIESGGSLNASGLLGYERALKRLQKTFALGTLGMRMSTILVNAGAAINVFYEIPTKDVFRGLFLAIKRPEAFKDAWNSPAIRRRLEEGATFEARIAKASGPSDNPVMAVLNATAEKGMFPINLVDTTANMLGAVVVWEHTRTKSLRAGLDEATARQEADAKVERLFLRAAQPTTRLARSTIEQRVLDNPLSAFLAMFISEPRKNLAITYMAVRELATGKGTYGKQMAAQQAFVGLVVGLALEHLLRSFYAAFAKAEPEDEDTLLARFLSNLTDPKSLAQLFLVSHLRAVPVFGQAWDFGVAKALDKPVFDRSPNPLVKLLDSPKHISTLFEGTTTQQADSATTLVQSLGTTIPGGSVVAQAANIADFALGVAASSGVDLSDEDRIARLKTRYSKFNTALQDELGKTTREDGTIDKDIQRRKHAALADKLRADLAPLTPELRAKALEAIDPPEKVLKLMTLPKP